MTIGKHMEKMSFNEQLKFIASIFHKSDLVEVMGLRNFLLENYFDMPLKNIAFYI